MQKNIKLTDKLTDHFDGNRSAVYVSVCLAAIGALLFVINSIILLSSPERTYRTLRIFLKAGTDLFWIAAATLGTQAASGAIIVRNTANSGYFRACLSRMDQPYSPWKTEISSCWTKAFLKTFTFSEERSHA